MSQNNRILIRGDGHIILFGIHNHYTLDLPPKLMSRLAPEEFRYTVGLINTMLAKEIRTNFLCFLSGCAFCLCSAGITLGPALLLNKRVKYKIRRILDKENKRMYIPLGMQWSLVKEKFGSMVEYGLQIQFVKKAEMGPD